MKDEIAATVFFITKLVRREERLSKAEVEKFAARLTTLLLAKYKNHWYPENPSRGQAFRAAAPTRSPGRYGERSRPFTVARFDGQENPELPQQISLAVGRAALDYHSSTSSDEESFSKEPRAIPTVSNPNSIYQFDFCKAPPQPWWQYLHRKPHLGEGSHFGQPRGYRSYRPTAAFAGPRVDRYHWINTKR
ncbi:Maternal B9.10 protein [Lonchura striata]|uniref:Maternal B9.10 protein n=1 Tax=Lonchura striata TaxID=40157 RepID=A0A218UFC6_9PASE|nr:protein BTG4 [Lonchura striata domestica]OWK52433.1 Maternal B9.10 protein [Lonchura striata domestica]